MQMDRYMNWTCENLKNISYQQECICSIDWSNSHQSVIFQVNTQLQVIESMNQPWTTRLQEVQSIFQVNTQVEVAESMNQPWTTHLQEEPTDVPRASNQ
jgi:hypothetical protein